MFLYVLVKMRPRLSLGKFRRVKRREKIKHRRAIVQFDSYIYIYLHTHL
jgi:hypothetical protein